MKKLLLVLLFAVSSFASAQSVLMTSNGIYNLSQVRAINYNTFSNSLELTSLNGNVTPYSGSNALALYTSIINQVGGSTGHATYIRVDGTYLYIKTSAAVNVFCNGANTAIGWQGASQDIADNCALFNKVKAVSIQ